MVKRLNQDQKAKRVVLSIVSLYVTTNIFMPKLDLGFAAFYLFEPIFILVVLLFIPKQHFRPTHYFERSYWYYFFFVVLSFWLGALYSQNIDTKSGLTLVKFGTFILVVGALRYASNCLSERFLWSILGAHVVFGVCAVGYVGFNMANNPINLGELIWTYSADYRVVGFTGQAIGANGLNWVGNTSVQMSVHLAFIFLLAISFYLHLNKIRYLNLAAIFFFAVLLTYSRTGLVVVLVGLSYLAVEKFRSWKVLWMLICVSITISYILMSDSFSAFFSSFGVIGKLVASEGASDGSALQRIDYVTRAIDFMQNRPWHLFLGIGYSDEYSTELIGTPHLESLILTTFFQSGIFAFALLCLHFYFLWSFARRASNCSRTLIRVVAYASKIYIPGLFLANLIGGNSLQTDFMSPFFYSLLGACAVLCSGNQKHKPRTLVPMALER